jgi:O-methyltransferase involved in polyketide biosynthesis
MFRMISNTGPLEAAGFDMGKRAFVLWLGVTPYLTEEAAFATLNELARLPGGAEVVFDYANPPDAIAEATTRFPSRDGRAGRRER